jgi:hypothetical protein
MRFYNARGELDGRAFTRTYGCEAEMVLSAIDCVLNGEKALYASSPLTTGRHLLSLFAQHGVRTTAELKERLGEAEHLRQTFGRTSAAANEFARTLRARSGGALVLTPAPFIAPDWSQPEYLALWETLIRTRFAALHFNQGWQYSNGCTFEFAVAADARLPTYDTEGRPLDLETALALVGAAIAEIEAAGFDAANLRAHRGRMEAVRATLPASGLAARA